VQVQLGIAPAVLWQAMRLQSARPGAIAYCANCESYFVFGPGPVTEELRAVSIPRDEGEAIHDDENLLGEDTERVNLSSEA
jgi:hypothetical protein